MGDATLLTLGQGLVGCERPPLDHIGQSGFDIVQQQEVDTLTLQTLEVVQPLGMNQDDVALPRSWWSLARF